MALSVFFGPFLFGPLSVAVVFLPPFLLGADIPKPFAISGDGAFSKIGA
jgi:hypothetical protein